MDNLHGLCLLMFIIGLLVPPHKLMTYNFLNLPWYFLMASNHLSNRANLSIEEVCQTLRKYISRTHNFRKSVFKKKKVCIIFVCVLVRGKYRGEKYVVLFILWYLQALKRITTQLTRNDTKRFLHRTVNGLHETQKQSARNGERFARNASHKMLTTLKSWLPGFVNNLHEYVIMWFSLGYIKHEIISI